MKSPAPVLPLRRLALALAACLVATTAAATPSITRLVYKTTATRTLELVCHLPSEWRSEDRRPAVVFFFGGGFWTWNGDQFSRQADYFARRGLVAILVDYRTGEKDGTKPPAAFEDARSAFRWIRSHADKLGIDPARLAAAGGSAGGTLAASLVIPQGIDAPDEDPALSPRPSALVLYNPALNTSLNERTLARFGDETTFRKTALALHPDLTPPPTLLLFGTEDTLLRGARTWADGAAARGARIDWHVVENAGHGFFNVSPHLAATTVAADRFLQDLGWLTPAPSVTPPDGDAPLSENAGNSERGTTR